MEAIHSRAHEYINRGFAPVPVEFKSKACRVNDWKNLRLSRDDVSGVFNDLPCNIGVVLGKLSDGLVDIDLDCREAISLAPYILPDTDMIFGRESKRASHWIYRVRDPSKGIRLADEDGGTLVELRANGQMTVFPGSVHPSGEAIEFERDGQPAEIEFGQLGFYVRQLAAASVLLRHWQKGQRHRLALAVAGTLIRPELDSAQVSSLIDALVRSAKDEEAEDRMQAVQTTEEKLKAGQPVTGRTALVSTPH